MSQLGGGGDLSIPGFALFICLLNDFFMRGEGPSSPPICYILYLEIDFDLLTNASSEYTPFFFFPSFSYLIIFTTVSSP